MNNQNNYGGDWDMEALDIPALKKEAPILTAHGSTRKGVIPRKNEDDCSVHENLGLFVVSDGMGSHGGGKIASAVVVNVLPIQVNDAFERGGRVVPNILDKSIRHLNSHINQYTRDFEEFRGAGATVAACLIQEGKAYLAHMGDSRGYLMRKGELARLTLDHSVVDLLTAMGQITREQAVNHPGRNTITRYVGMDEPLGPDINFVDLQEGDRILLCTDGLTDQVSEQEIGAILWGEPNLDEACHLLTEAANEAGGRDNVTAVIVQYGERNRETIESIPLVVIKPFKPDLSEHRNKI